MDNATRATLETAANAYFASLLNEVDRPRGIAADELEYDLPVQIEQSNQRIRDLEGRIAANEFSARVLSVAKMMAGSVGIDFSALDHSTQTVFQQLILRAERQQMRYAIHALEAPTSRFVSDDELLGRLAPSPTALTTLPMPETQKVELNLGEALSLYVGYQTQKGWGGSMQEETLRLFTWLREEVPADTAVAAITRDQMRQFRNALLNLRKGNQGRKLPLKDRIGPAGAPLMFVTRERYWRFTRAFFEWLEGEHEVESPVRGLRFEGGKGEVRHSPEAFSLQEIEKLWASPLYAGSKSIARRSIAGSVLREDGFWWSGVIMAFMGMRASDCVQLCQHDFHLKADIPHVIIGAGKLPDGTPKESKFGSRTHAVPVPPALLDLGLAEFVAKRAKSHPKERLLYEVGLGTHRVSDKLTKLWSRYLTSVGLKKPGRATHVFRHTVIARLRAAGVSNEDSGAVVGHTEQSVTASYGGDQPLTRKYDTLLKLDLPMPTASKQKLG